MKYFVGLLLLAGTAAFAKIPEKIDAVLLHPLFDRYYVCAEHTGDQDWGLGDSLGSDCIIHSFVEVDGKKWMRSHKGIGHKNEDWFGWKQNVLAPLDGKIVKVNINSIVNQPGIIGKGIATMVVVKGDDGVNVSIAHLRELKVKEGDLVKRGQIIGLVGNNGQSWHPHIHIGAWKNKTPVQIRFDQHKILMK